MGQESGSGVRSQESKNLRTLGVIFGQGLDEFDGFEADADDLADEADDVFVVVFAVGVGLDAGAFVFADLVLVDDPLEGGAVAETVLEDFGGMSASVNEGLICSAVLAMLRRIFSTW